jgi:hypothetical protein
MQEWFASAIAVAGTLGGVAVAQIFQRASAEHARDFERQERRRQERLEAYGEFTAAIMALRQGVVALWFKRHRDAEKQEVHEAYTESDRLGATANHARSRVQLVTDDPHLVAAADACIEVIGALRESADLQEIKQHELQLQETFTSFITTARDDLRPKAR